MARRPKTSTEQLVTEQKRTNAEMAQLHAFAAEMTDWKPALEVMTDVRAVPTPFCQIDRVTRVGGWPIERIALVHGKSNEGKTALIIGLGLGFLQRQHFYLHVDAEYTTPATWLQQLMGQQAKNPLFRGLRPRTYEETTDKIRRFAENFEKGRKAGKIGRQTSGVVIIDSIAKLVPRRLWKELTGSKEGQTKGARGATKDVGIDGMNGRGAMYKAALNSQWMHEAVPMFAHAGLALVIVGREYAKQAKTLYDDDFELAGGRGLWFDSALVCRVLRSSWVTDKQEKGPPLVYGEQHMVEVRKTKVGAKDEKHPRVHFHTSNGMLDGVPLGFDRARDVLELGLELGIVKRSGAWYSRGTQRLGQGEHGAVRRMTVEPALLESIERDVRAAFSNESRIKA